MGSILSQKYDLTKSYFPNHCVQILNANSAYIISTDGLDLYIYCLDSNPYPISIIASNSPNIHAVEMHHNYKNIFLSISENEIKIWEIIENKKKCEAKITIRGHKKGIIKALFCKNNDKQFISYSKDNTIKIWSMDKSFCITSISVKNKIKNIEFFQDHLFYQEENESIVIYDPVKLIKRSTIKIKLEKFFVIFENVKDKDPYDFIIFNEKRLILKSNINKKLIFDDEPRNIFYDDNFEIIYIFFNCYLEIIKAKTMEILLNITNKYEKTFYIDNQINNKYICGNFLYSTNPVTIYSFSSKEIYNPEKIKVLSKPKPDFWAQFIPIISNMQSLSWDNNIETPKNDFVFKNYLNDETIKAELFSNFNKNLKQKRLEVLNTIKNFVINKNDLDANFIEFIRMLIKDNTNKDLIIKYLNYLQKYENKLKYEFIDKFNDEYNYYKIMFDDKELKDNNFVTKGRHSEKDLFFTILDSIRNIDINQDILKDQCFLNIEEKIKKIQIFNQPIKFENKELYWHRNCFIIYYSLKKIKDINDEEKRIETFKLMQNSINNITNRKLFQKDYINNNKILLTCLLSLIALPQNDDYCNFNLNLIESKDPDKNAKLEKYQMNISNDNEKIYEQIIDEDICAKNLILKTEKKLDLEEIELKNYDEIEKYFKKIIDIEKVNKLLSKIFCSNVIKEAFKILYPAFYKFPFKDQNEALEFINDNFNYVPYKSLKTGAITEKYTLEVYYFLQAKKIFFNKANLNQEKINLINKIFYNSNAIKTNTHEMNHNFHNLLFMQSNGINTIETPRKNNVDISESGKNLERLLFKRCLYRMTLSECIYILNEKNYDKTLEDFREDFNDIKDKDLQFEKNGVFSEFNNIENFINDKLLLTNSIMVSDDNYDNDENDLSNFFIDNIEDDSDVLGFIRV